MHIIICITYNLVVIIIKNFCLKYLSIVSICFILLLVIFSLLVLTNKIHDQNSNYTYLMGVVILFVSGFLLSNHYQKQGFIIGAIQSICFILLFCLINVLAFEEVFNFSLFIKFVIYFISGVLGGIIGVNIKKIV